MVTVFTLPCLDSRYANIQAHSLLTRAAAMATTLLRLMWNKLRAGLRTATPLQKCTALVAILLLLEAFVHVRQYEVPRPPRPLDGPFYTGCQDPIRNTTDRASAVLLMLARNSEVKGAVASVRSVQEQFNDHFGYPWVFLNDEGWSGKFKDRVSRAVGDKADVKFEQIPPDMWGCPEWVDQAKAEQDMQIMDRNKEIKYGGSESYHHMCRFQSGYVASPQTGEPHSVVPQL